MTVRRCFDGRFRDIAQRCFECTLVLINGRGRLLQETQCRLATVHRIWIVWIVTAASIAVRCFRQLLVTVLLERTLCFGRIHLVGHVLLLRCRHIGDAVRLCVRIRGVHRRVR